MGLQILVSVRFQVWVFVSIWYVFGKKVQNRVWSWWISRSFPLQGSEKKLLLRVLWHFFTSPNLMLKLFEDGIYATGTVRPNRKHMPTLKADKQMKRGEHDWLAYDKISTTKWMVNRSVILLSNYHNPSVVQEINRRAKGSKEKVKVSCHAVICEYNTYMGVGLCNRMNVSYQVERRSKVRFHLWVFFDFLDISIVNLNIVYDKIQSTAAISSMDFWFSLAHSMIETFSNWKKVIST